MAKRLNYGVTAKALHWLVVVLLIIQYSIGWFMPDIHRGMTPGSPMVLHVSFGMLILILIAFRLGWRLTHPVPPESSLPAWQRYGAEAVHWLLYVLLLATAMTGWLFASFRGWSMSLFSVIPLPMLSANPDAGRFINGWHQYLEWALLIVIGLHVLAALTHLFIYRDRIMQRMLPG